jgi:hypothetical protein
MGAGRKQVWDNTAIAGPWLNLMRNSTDAQIFSFHHPDFLAACRMKLAAELPIISSRAPCSRREWWRDSRVAAGRHPLRDVKP